MWTDLDREKAVAYTQHLRESCPECGTREEQWDPEQGGSLLAFIAGTWRCHGCQAIAQEQDNIPDQEKGIKVVLIPNPELASG